MKKSCKILLSLAVACAGIGMVSCAEEVKKTGEDTIPDTPQDKQEEVVKLDGEYVLNDFESVADFYSFKPVDSSLAQRGTFDVSSEQRTHGEKSMKYTHRVGAEMKMNFYIAQTPYPEMDISTLTQVSFDVYNGGQNDVSVKIALAADKDILSAETVKIATGEWGIVALDTPLTLTRPNADTINLVSLTIIAPEAESAGAAYYIDNFKASFDEDIFNVDDMLTKLDTMIDALPAAENLTDENRSAVDEAYAIYNLFTDNEKTRVTKAEKLIACREKILSFPYAFYDASDALVTDKFTGVATSAVGLEWTGNMSTITDENGKAWIKIHVDTVGKQGAMAFSYSLSGIDLSEYDYLTFTVRGGPTKNARIRIITKEWGANITSWTWYDGTSESGQDMLLSTTLFANDNYLIVVAGIPAAADVDIYFSDFTAYGWRYVQSLIDNLPDPADMTEADMAEVADVYSEYQTLSEAAQAKVDTTKLTACRNALVQPGDEDEIVAMIDALPAPENVVYTDRTAIMKALAAYNAALEKVQEQVGDKYDKLTACVSALDGLPYLIYDASDADVINKFTMITSSGAGLNWTGTITKAEDAEGNWIKFHMTTRGSQNAACVTYSLEGVDLSDYEYVHVKVKGGSSENMRFAIVIQEWQQTVFSKFFDFNGEDIYIPVNQFAAAQENYFRLVIQNIENGEDVYFSDFTAYGVRSIQKLIDALPATDQLTQKDVTTVRKIRSLYEALSASSKAQVNTTKLVACEEALEGGQDEVIALIAALPEVSALTPEDKTAVMEAQSAYDLLSDSAKALVTNAKKLTDCVARVEKLPYLFYDARDSKVTDRFSVMISAGAGCEWTGTITTISDEDGNWIKFHEETRGTQTAIYTPYDLTGITLNSYDYVAFKIKGGNQDARVRIITKEFGAGVNSWIWYNKNGITEIVIPVSQFAWSSTQWYLIIAGLGSNTDIYLGSFYAYSAESIQDMIDYLPEASAVAESDATKIAQVRAYYDYLSTDAKAKVTTAKLEACEAALIALSKPYAFFDMSSESALSNFTHPTDVASYVWEGDFTIGTSNDEKVLSVNASGTTSVVYIGYDTTKISAAEYDYVVFKVYNPTAKSLRLCLITKGWGAKYFDTQLAAQSWTEVKVSVSNFVSAGYIYLADVKGTAVSILFTDFIGYNAKVVQAMIEALPDADKVTESDRSAVSEARKYYDYLSDDAKAKVTITKLEACEAALTTASV